jgi:protocatechuate 3,4-dioxygenase beta subunit
LLAPDWNDKGKKLAINGVVYKADGTPRRMLLYMYIIQIQTGIYPKKGDETGWGKRHGYIRGWMKTNEKGEYKFFTLSQLLIPATSPEHIHVTIKEPDRMNTGSMNIFLMTTHYSQVKKEKIARIGR